MKVKFSLRLMGKLKDIAVTLLFFSALIIQTGQALALDWSTGLSRAEQSFLAPLKYEWSAMDSAEQTKWRALAKQHQEAPAHKQELMRERVRRWASLSPEQRETARKNFNALKDKQRGERNSAWNSYQHLDEEQKSDYKNIQKQNSAKESINPNLPAGTAAFSR